MPVIVIIKTMKEAKWTSYVALSTTYIATILALGYALSFYLGPDYERKSEIYDFDTVPLRSSIFLGFAVYLFSLGAHPIFPSLYAELNVKQQWGLVTNLGWLIVCGLYFPAAIIGYLVFGNSLNGNDTILVTLRKFVGPSYIINIGEVLFCIHFMCAIPIFACPCFFTLNEYLQSKGQPLLGDTMNRIVIMTILVVIALFFPYFSDIMGLISDISTSLAVLILPALFYWKLCRPSNKEKVWLIIILVFGIAASVIGIEQSISDLIKNIYEHPLSDFFKGVFLFNCSYFFSLSTNEAHPPWSHCQTLEHRHSEFDWG